MPNQAQVLAELGFAPFTKAEIINLLGKLKTELEIGLNRQGGPGGADGGLLAIPNPIKVPAPALTKNIPPGTKVLAAALGGTNWQLALAEFTGSHSPLTLRKLAGLKVPRTKRQFSGRRPFANFIADFIIQGAKPLAQEKLVPTLAIALGFPQENLRLDHGLDARLPGDRLPKFWQISQGKDMLVGQEILMALKERRWQLVKQVLIANDTVAVALDQTAAFNKKVKLKILPAGFVIGTGSNATIERQGKLINLEIGLAHSLGYDPILKEMERLGQSSAAEPWLEHYTGGAFLIKRLACGLILANEQGILKTKLGQVLLANRFDSKILSRLAAEKMALEELEGKTKTTLGNDFTLVCRCARQVMIKAAQVAGVMIGAVIQTATWSEGVIPVEGAIFWQGQLGPNLTFQKGVEKTLSQICPNQLAFVPASGMRGIATLAMVENQSDAKDRLPW